MRPPTRLRNVVPIAALFGTLVMPMRAPALVASSARTATRVTTPAIVRAGIKPIHPGVQPDIEQPVRLQSSALAGAIAQHPAVYLVFWGAQWTSDPDGAATALQQFFQGVYGADDSWGLILDQYCAGLRVGTTNCGIDGSHVVHPTSSVLAGAWFDNAHDAPDAASPPELGDEAIAAAEHFGNTTQNSNLDAQYVIASPSGTHPDGFPNTGFCAWHSTVTNNAVGGSVAFTNLPYVPDLGPGACTTIDNASDLDGYFSTETHEYAESVTDLWPSGGWLDDDGFEIADKCQDFDTRLALSTGTFDVQGLWSNVDGQCELAEAQDLAPAFRHAPSIRVDGLYDPVAGDFNADGNGDVLWYAPGSAPDSVWRGNASGGFANGPGVNVTGSYEPLAGDFNGDGHADVVWYAPGTANDYMWRGTTGGCSASTSLTINGFYDPLVGDFNGDGIADILWYAAGNGHDSIWLGGPSGFRNGPSINVNGQYEPVTGDFNGDGFTDVLWYAPGPGADYLWNGGSGANFGPTIPLTINGLYQPIAGDFDGDGFTDLLWYAPGTATDYLWRGRSSGFTSAIRLAINGLYVPLTTDVNGDGKTDIVWYAPGTAPDSTWLGVAV